MSVQDVAAVDRLSSLRRPAHPGGGPRAGAGASLPTSPVREDQRTSDTLRRAMARHQASLSRPESPRNLNDDLPSTSRLARPSPGLRSGGSGLGSHYASPAPAPMSGGGLGPSYASPSPALRRRDSARESRYRLVSSTGHRAIPATGRGETPGLEETKASLRSSQLLLHEAGGEQGAVGGRTLPRMENIRDTISDDVPELSTKKYPYLSNSTYSLPRNHRLLQHQHKPSTRQFASTLRESQESLMSTSREFLAPESRESLLSRYPSSGTGTPSPRLPRRPPPADDAASSFSRLSSRPHSAASSRQASPQRSEHTTRGYHLQSSHSSSQLGPAYHQQQQPPRATPQPPHHEPSPFVHHTPAQARAYSRGYTASDQYEGYHSDYDYRKVPSSPAASSRSSRAASPASSRPHSRRVSPSGSVFSSRSSYSRRASPSSHSRRSSRANSPQLGERYRHPDYYETQEYIRKASIRLQGLTSPATPSSGSSRAGSSRSSRAASPAPSLDQLLVAAQQQTEAGSHKIVFVRETFQIIPDTTLEDTSRLPRLRNHNLVKIDSKESHLRLDQRNMTVEPVTMKEKSSSEERIKVLDDIKSDIYDTVKEVSCDKTTTTSEVGVMTDTEEEGEDGGSVVTQGSRGSSARADKGVTVDLSQAGISNIEQLLESLSRRVHNVESGGGLGGQDLVDNDDSARAESVASLGTSSTGSRGRARRGQEGGAVEAEAHSMIRRQSVIIEGLTLETDELKRRCQMLEDELATPGVDELQQKLDKVEGKLEETENYCYQVVEENVELKNEIETLESEISEVQDTFRDKDAKEFKKTKWELENLAKTCRNLQLKLGKAQAKASRLRQEKDEMEEQQREQKLWKTTAVVAAAALAVVHLVNKYK